LDEFKRTGIEFILGSEHLDHINYSPTNFPPTSPNASKKDPEIAINTLAQRNVGEGIAGRKFYRGRRGIFKTKWNLRGGW
jgi:hypothetical protein